MVISGNFRDETASKYRNCTQRGQLFRYELPWIKRDNAIENYS